MNTTKNLILCLLSVAIFSVFFASCSLSGGLQSYDDVYFNPKVDEVRVQSDFRSVDPHFPKTIYQDSSESSRLEKRVKTIQNHDTKQNTVKTTDNTEEGYNDDELQDYDLSPSAGSAADGYSYYDEDSYYDYAYAARIRRFHRPCVGLNYYNDYYTNLYWYTYDPFSWGVSIYLGYGWWYPHYGYRPYYSYRGYIYPHFHGYYGWGWGYPSYAYGWSYYYPYSYFGYSYAYYPTYGYYYNARDRNSFYYRTASSSGGNGLDYDRSISRQVSSSKSSGSTGAMRKSDATFGDKYERSLNATRISQTAGRSSMAVRNTDENHSQTTVVRRQGVDLNLNKVNSQNSVNATRFGVSPVSQQPTNQNISNTSRQLRNSLENTTRHSVNSPSKRATTRTYTPPSTRQPRRSGQYTRTNERNANRPFLRNNNSSDVRSSTPARRSEYNVNTSSQRSGSTRSSAPSRDNTYRSGSSSSSAGSSSAGRATRR